MSGESLVMLQLRKDSCLGFKHSLDEFCPCCPWFLSADILKQGSLCHFSVQIIVRYSKACDGNDYGVENNRFPLAGADC